MFFTICFIISIFYFKLFIDFLLARNGVGPLRAPIVAVPATSGERKGREWWWVIKM